MPYRNIDGEVLSIADVKSKYNLSSGDSLDPEVMDFLGLEFVPIEALVDSVEDAKSRKNSEINLAWMAADNSQFEYSGKTFSMDASSKSRIQSITNEVILTNALPPTFSGEWKSVDNSTVPIPDVDTFKTFVSAMSAAQLSNFIKAQTLKTSLAASTTFEEIASVVW